MDEEQIVQRYKKPGPGLVIQAEEWLIRNGARPGAVQMATVTAEFIGEAHDIIWIEALHRVVNQEVRENRPGWGKYEGNWVDFTRMFESIEP